MATDFSSIVVQLIGAMVAVASVLGLVMPDVLVRLVTKVAERGMAFPFATSVQILLGASVLTAAAVSRFPALFTAFGWITIVAVIVLVFVGQRGMQRTLQWVARWSATPVRICLAVAAVIGVFLVYGVS